MLITDVSQQSLEETAQLAREINAKIPLIVEIANITEEKVVDELVQRTVAKFGRLDYALNVAGMCLFPAQVESKYFHLMLSFTHHTVLGISGVQAPIVDLTLDNYNQVESVNARAVWLCERAQIKQMLKQDRCQTQYDIQVLKSIGSLTEYPSPSDGRPGDRGSIVNIASICGFVGFVNSTPYTMAKHGESIEPFDLCFCDESLVFTPELAVLGLVKSDSTTFGGQGIRVNAVCPG